MSGSYPGVSGSFGELRGGFRDPVRPCGAKKGRKKMGGGRSCEGSGLQLCPWRVHGDLLSSKETIDWSGQIPRVDRDLFGTRILNHIHGSGGGPRTKDSKETADLDPTDFLRALATDCEVIRGLELPFRPHLHARIPRMTYVQATPSNYP